MIKVSFWAENDHSTEAVDEEKNLVFKQVAIVTPVQIEALDMPV